MSFIDVPINVSTSFVILSTVFSSIVLSTSLLHMYSKYSNCVVTGTAGESAYAGSTSFEVLSPDAAYVSQPAQKAEGLFGWFSGGIVNKVLEKTKASYAKELIYTVIINVCFRAIVRFSLG